MAAEIKNLDTDLQMLVYENYSKFISATDTIKRLSNPFTYNFLVLYFYCSSVEVVVNNKSLSNLAAKKNCELVVCNNIS